MLWNLELCHIIYTWEIKNYNINYPNGCELKVNFPLTYFYLTDFCHYDTFCRT